RDDDKLYKFKEGDFKRLRIQDIEDMLLLLIQGRLTNLIVEERFAFNVSLRMFTRSIVIQRRVKDLQLGVKSYQKKLNLTKPDAYRSDLKTMWIEEPIGYDKHALWGVSYWGCKRQQFYGFAVNRESARDAVNEQLEAEVLTRSSHSSKTSYAVDADPSKMELKKILIEKMEGNKSIQRSDEQRNLYKALVEAYESDKIILDTYGETDEEPSTGPDRGSKRRREGKKPESASAPTETATKSAGRSTQGSRSRQASASESALAEEPMQ
nr:hypothetical protein [Tanacetum cinerariifolium]